MHEHESARKGSWAERELARHAEAAERELGRHAEAAVHLRVVTESARACSYILSKQVQKICSFWLLTLWLLTVPSFSI